MNYKYLAQQGASVGTYQAPKHSSKYYLKQKFDFERYQRHRSNISKAKTVIDNKAPRVHMHIQTKLRRLQQQGDRMAIVERDNKFLLEQIAKIMRSRGKMDHINHDYKEKSMFRSKRQKELLRITNENIRILKRLEERKTNYSQNIMNEEFMKSQSFMTCISKFDHMWRGTTEPYQLRKDKRLSANKGITEKVSSYVDTLSNKSWAHTPSNSTVPKQDKLDCEQE